MLITKGVSLMECSSERKELLYIIFYITDTYKIAKAGLVIVQRHNHISH